MTLEEFLLQAEACNYDFSCNNVEQADIDNAEAFIFSTLGINDCYDCLPCCCSTDKIKCAIVNHVYNSTEISVANDENAVIKKTHDYLKKIGCLSYGNW